MKRRQLLFGALAILLLAAVGAGVWIGRRARTAQWEERPLEGLGIYGTVPDFSLTERSGRKVDLTELKGKIWVVNFIYTHCPDSCPMQSARIKELQDEFINEKDLRLVSITVDPSRDTLKVLSEYANRFAADPERWLFLNGEKEAIYRLAQEGLHLAAVEIPQEQRTGSGATHAHSPRFVLMDRKARVRGYYAPSDPEAMVRLRRDLARLLHNG